VNAPSPPLLELPAEEAGAILQKWLTHTLETYPEQTSRFLLQDQDPFSNPVGRALNEGLPVLLEEVMGSLDRERAGPVLEEIVRIRAVQEFSSSQALGFIFRLRGIIREEIGDGRFDSAGLDERIDKLALLAFEHYVRCREKMAAIKLGEAKRRVFVLERMASREPRS